jgi:hypothetical protein
MRRPRRFLSFFLGALVGLTGCGGGSGSPLEPSSPSFLLGVNLGGLNALLLSCSPLPYAKSTVTLGTAGGSVSVGPHTLVVPAGALSEPVTISAENISDNVNSVRFSPEGLQFQKAASLTMSYSNCSGLGMLLPKKVAYTTELLSILELLQSVDLAGQKKVTGQLKHFSRYAVAY